MSDFTIIELNTVDSTNNYAMHMIDANKAQHGLTITAKSQTEGKGQRGNQWLDRPGDSLLMSIIVDPKRAISGQFSFNAAIAVAIANVLQNIAKNATIHIKWPNDIIVDDKKAGGILIENVLRGQLWAHSVVGVGINVRQEKMNEELPFATSLKIATGIDVDMVGLRNSLIESIRRAVDNPSPPEKVMAQYNELLYKRGSKQTFSDNTGQWEATVLNAQDDGTLQVQKEEGNVSYQHGQVRWVW